MFLYNVIATFSCSRIFLCGFAVSGGVVVIPPLIQSPYGVVNKLLNGVKSKGAVMQVQLLKKVGTYQDKETGKDKQYVNFYLRCGDTLIPIQPCFFPDKDNDNRDYQYNGRKEVLKSFADILPDKPKEKLEDGNSTPF